MPTACEWMQSQRAHRKGEDRFWKQQKVWGGGAWKTKVGYQPPSRGCPCSFLTRDGRAWTPGPGRYSEGNPMESSVRYDRVKFSKTHSLLDEQKRRWPGDSCPMAWQPAGVIVNPARGFSMGSGCGPGECWMREVERRSRITSFGFNYQDIAPDLVIGEHAKTSRAGTQGSVFHAAGGEESCGGRRGGGGGGWGAEGEGSVRAGFDRAWQGEGSLEWLCSPTGMR